MNRIKPTQLVGLGNFLSQLGITADKFDELMEFGSDLVIDLLLASNYPKIDRRQFQSALRISTDKRPTHLLAFNQWLVLPEIKAFSSRCLNRNYKVQHRLSVNCLSPDFRKFFPANRFIERAIRTTGVGVYQILQGCKDTDLNLRYDPFSLISLGHFCRFLQTANKDNGYGAYIRNYIGEPVIVAAKWCNMGWNFFAFPFDPVTVCWDSGDMIVVGTKLSPRPI